MRGRDRFKRAGIISIVRRVDILDGAL